MFMDIKDHVKNMRLQRSQTGFTLIIGASRIKTESKVFIVFEKQNKKACIDIEKP